MSDREALIALFREALGAVHAGRAVARALPGELRAGERVVLLAVGKAAPSMARAALDLLGDGVVGGAVHSASPALVPLGVLSARVAGHPLPDERSLAAADEALQIATRLSGDHTLLVLLSGGASALWCAPAHGLTLDDKRRTTEALLRSGAQISELNAARKHLSRIKGGQLARAAATHRIATLAVSDVRGDRADTIGSGPTTPDGTSYRDALDVLERHALAREIPPAVLAHLRAGERGERPETAREGELAGARFRVIASLDLALEAAAAAARRLGISPILLGATLYGDVAELARALAGRVRAARDALILAGGEPSVSVRGAGRGGRCQELAVRLALELEGESGWTALCAGSDGADGSTDVAGAVVDATSLVRMRAAGCDARAALARSDSYALLAASSDQLRTGPTDTNVADLVLIRVRR